MISGARTRTGVRTRPRVVEPRPGRWDIGSRHAAALVVVGLCPIVGISAAACGASASSTTSTAAGTSTDPVTRIRASAGVTEALTPLTW